MTNKFGITNDVEYISFLESIVRLLRDRILEEEQRYFNALGYLGYVLAANNNKVVISKEIQTSFDVQKWDIDEHMEAENLVIELVPHQEEERKE